MNKKKIIESMRYLFLILVISLGLVTITATGGGGGGDSDGGDDSCDYNTDVVCEDGCDKTCLENSGSPANFIIFNNKLIFSAYEGCENISQNKLFELDGAGNYSEIIESDIDIEREKIILNGTLYFISDGYLYKYDESNQAEKIFPDYAESIFTVENLMAYNGSICFSYYNSSSDSYELYSYNGSGTPTLLGDTRANGSYAVHNGKLYFIGYTEDSGNELWCYDEAGSGLSMFADINPSGDSKVANIVLFKERLYFSADNGTNGVQIWVTDGQQAPEMVTDVPGVEYDWGTDDPWIRPVAVFQERLLCEAVEQVGSEVYKRLYQYDGTNPLEPLEVGDSYDSQYVESYAILNNHFYFLAVDTSTGIWNARYVWDYDGEQDPVKIETDTYVSNIYLNNTELLLQGENKVYSYDGSSTEVLFEAGALGLDALYLQKVFDNRYFVTGSNETNGSELWAIDDSGEINLVEDFYPGTTCDCDCGD